jgi:hypothetical protein
MTGSHTHYKANVAHTGRTVASTKAKPGKQCHPRVAGFHRAPEAAVVKRQPGSRVYLRVHIPKLRKAYKHERSSSATIVYTNVRFNIQWTP